MACNYIQFWKVPVMDQIAAATSPDQLAGSRQQRISALVVTVIFAAAILLLLLLSLLRKAVWAAQFFLWEPLRLRRIMLKQGVRGPPFCLIVGNLPESEAYAKNFPDNLDNMSLDDGDEIDHDYRMSPSITPQYSLFFPKYGKRFVYSWGAETRVVVKDPEMAKQVLSSQFGNFVRSPLEDSILSLVLGNGLANAVGAKWTNERRTLAPLFHQESLKGMVEDMVKVAATEIRKWEKKVNQEGGLAEIDVEPSLHAISGNILTAVFFSNDYEKGDKLYKLQTKLVGLLYQAFPSFTFWIPGFSLVPTKLNRTMAQTKRDVHTLLHEMVASRRKEAKLGSDFAMNKSDMLGHMLAAADNNNNSGSTANCDKETASDPQFNLTSVFNNLKLFYFAGQDTVANLTTFAMLLMARHPQWQDRARKEVLELTKQEDDEVAEEALILDSAILARLKVVGMILHETARLFTSVPSITRVAAKDVRLGDLFIPKGLAVEIAVHAMHMDPEVWGENVTKFNPERFANGTASASSHPQAFLPFGCGPKVCIGNNFALMEAKVVVALVLRRFQILPSPNYKHHPHCELIQRPKFGMNLIFKSLN